MFRYVTLTDKNTIDKESAESFEGGIQVWVSNDVLSTFLNTPWLCWVERNADGSYLLHVPADAPRPEYEQKIADFTSQLATLQQNDTALKASLDDATKKNQALVAQIREMQAQNSLLSAQVAQLSSDDQAKSSALDSANAKIQQQSNPVSSSSNVQEQAPASSSNTVNYTINK